MYLLIGERIVIFCFLLCLAIVLNLYRNAFVFVITVYVTVLFSKVLHTFELLLFYACFVTVVFSTVGLPPFELFFLCMVYVTVVFSKGIAHV